MKVFLTEDVIKQHEIAQCSGCHLEFNRNILMTYSVNNSPSILLCQACHQEHRNRGRRTRTIAVPNWNWTT